MRIIFLLILLTRISHAQTDLQADSLQKDLRTAVTLSTQIDTKEIPLNRTVTLTVRLSWQGEIDYIDIKEIEEPVLSNLQIMGSSASNKTMDTGEGLKAVKEISYILQPVSLGMGYVETVGVSYEDKLSGKSHHLKTNRVAIEAVSAVPVKGEMQISWIWIMAGIIIVISGAMGIFFLLKKRKDSEEIQEKVKIPEEKYLEVLKKELDLNSGDKNESFTILSKIFRKYLAEKYGISALETSTDELLEILSKEELDEELIKKSKKLFSKADVVKFSGKNATQAELDEAYTAVETILETHLTQERKKREEKQEERKKSSKGFLKKTNKK